MCYRVTQIGVFAHFVVLLWNLFCGTTKMSALSLPPSPSLPLASAWCAINFRNAFVTRVQTTAQFVICVVPVNLLTINGGSHKLKIAFSKPPWSASALCEHSLLNQPRTKLMSNRWLDRTRCLFVGSREKQKCLPSISWFSFNSSSLTHPHYPHLFRMRNTIITICYD